MYTTLILISYMIIIAMEKVAFIKNACTYKQANLNKKIHIFCNLIYFKSFMWFTWRGGKRSYSYL